MTAKVKVFSAVDDKEATSKYLEGYQKVLEAYGVPKVTSAQSNWIDNPHAYVILITDEDESKILAGGRIQVRTPKAPMPMEMAIAILDKSIYPYVDAIGDFNVAEFCGLYNSKEVAGLGIGSIMLGRIGVAITEQLGIKNLMALCSPATLRNCLKVGFEPIKSLGNNGTLYYPKEDLVATALIIQDIINLPQANPEERKEIFKLRSGPADIAVLHGPKGEVKFHYNLTIPQVYTADVY